MPRGGAAGRFLTSRWCTHPFLSRSGTAPPPGAARRQSSAGVDGSTRMLIRGRPPPFIGRLRSVGEVSAESQKNRAGPTAACSASGAGRALPVRRPATRKVSPRQPSARPRSPERWRRRRGRAPARPLRAAPLFRARRRLV